MNGDTNSVIENKEDLLLSSVSSSGDSDSSPSCIIRKSGSTGVLNTPVIKENEEDVETNGFFASSGTIKTPTQSLRMQRQLSRMDIKEEHIDLNFFDSLLGDSDPEMSSLLDLINNGDFVNYNLPSRPEEPYTPTPTVIPNPPPSSSNTTTTTVIKLDELMMDPHTHHNAQNDGANSDSFKDFCELLALNKSDITTESSEITNTESKKSSTTATEENLNNIKPSRVSQRLKSKRSRLIEETDEVKEEVEQPSQNKPNSTKRKRSLEGDDQVVTISDSHSSDGEDVMLGGESSTGGSSSGIGNTLFNDIDHDTSDLFDDDEYTNRKNRLKEFVKRAQMDRMDLNSSSRRLSEFEVGDLDVGGLLGGKKDSNKEAATKYRLKKLSEKDQLFDMRGTLEKDNDGVKKKIELVQTEINYLKMLLVQMLTARGVDSSDLIKA